MGQPLPFPAWLEQTYPEKTAKREFLRMIGALDVAYLMYRTKRTEKKQRMQKTQRIQRIDTTVRVPSMPLKVEEHTKLQKKKTQKKPAKDEITMEFDHKPATSVVDAPQQHRGVYPESVEWVGAVKIAKAPKKAKNLTISFHKEADPVIIHPKKIPAPVVHETPEPLVLEIEPTIENPAAPRSLSRAEPRGGRGSKKSWLDDPLLEETELRKLKQPLTTDGITVSFDVRNNQGDDETVITINNTAWRALLTSPSLDLSAMAQIVRVSYGELYVLGRMALGAMSGEGYIESAEAVRIVTLLAEATGSTVTCDITYFDKDAASKTRTSNFLHVRFERV